MKILNLTYYFGWVVIIRIHSHVFFLNYKLRFCTAFACPNIIPDIKWGISKKCYKCWKSTSALLSYHLWLKWANVIVMGCAFSLHHLYTASVPCMSICVNVWIIIILHLRFFFFCEKIPSHEMNQFLFAIYYFFVTYNNYVLASTYSINSKRVEGTEVVHL